MESAPFYTHSGKFSVGSLLLWTALACLASSIVAVAYAYGIFFIPFIYINAILAGGFGFVLSKIILFAMRKANVRSPQAFRYAAVFVTAWALYFHWAIWLAIVVTGNGLQGVELVLQPGLLWEVMQAILGEGIWTLFGVEVSGVMLAIVWVLEAGIIFFFSLKPSFTAYSDLPFCESCNTWCKKEENVLRLWHPEQSVVLAVFKDKNYGALKDFSVVLEDEQEGQWYECDLKVCPNCGTTSTLDLTLVATHLNTKGEIEKDTTKIVENILLSTAEVDALKNHYRLQKGDTATRKSEEAPTA